MKNLFLQNERLNVEIATPGTFYRGSRFDWSGFVTQITLDGKHTFCAPESLEKGEGSGGRGLCNEFGIFQPIGYDDAEVGEYFPKLGVGLLRRLDARAYNFLRSYPIKPFPLQVREMEDAIEFEFDPLLCRGYAARFKKTLRLGANSLHIEYELENVGEKPLKTHEYNHNFLAINDAFPGPDYRLQLSQGLNLRISSPILSQQNDEIRWIGAPRQVGLSRTPDKSFQAPGAVWQLSHEPSGVGLSETVSCPLERLTLWWTPHVLSPEMFVDLLIVPGQMARWRREYKFWNQE